MIVEPYLIFSIIIGVIGLIIVLFLRRWVLQQPIEDEKAREVSRWIKTGARAFLKKESTAVLGFIIGISIVLGLLAYLEILEYHILIGFVVGSLLSLGMAYLGMETATDANVRTTEAARKDSMRAFQIAYRGGAVTGLSLVSLSILGIGILFMLFESPSLVVGFGFGASLAALFAQLGGGIFTKSADIGADLVGKVEEKLEEDDPRNAAVIADLVGDNVGDCAGRASDLFESFSDNIIAIMILGSFIAIYAYEIDFKIALPFIILPITLQAIGIIANTIGVFATLSKDPTKAVRWSYIISAALVIVGFFFTIELMIGPVESYLHNDFMFSERIFLAALLGLGGSLLTVLLVNYYTGYQNKPVQEIKQAAEGGAALDILAGMSLGLESAFPEAVVIGLVMIGSFFLGAGSFTLSGIDPIKGLYGASMSVIGLLSMTGIIQTSDTFGPIVDNADGIATMAGLGDEVGTSLETLDAVGNTTKALTKAYGMAAAILTGISVLFAYITEVVREEGMLKAGDITFEKLMEVMAANIVNPLVLFGILIGAAVPFLFSAWAIKGAQRGAFHVVEEVRSQFRANPDILEGKALPDYAKSVGIATKVALVDMVMPTLLGVFMPIIMGVSFGVIVLAGYLVALKIVSALLAIFEFNAGGALDNAKKLVEISGKKGTDLHAATVIGDTFGDPLKDTAGPSLHILIKLSNILSITMIPLFLFVEDLSLVMRFGIAGAVVLIWIIISLIVKYIRKKL